MKFIFLILLIRQFGTFLSAYDGESIFRDTLEEEDKKTVQNLNACDQNTHSGIWSCTKNEENGNLTLTYDCNVNSKKKANLWIWSPKFPSNVDILNIQNCEELKLFMGYNSERSQNQYGELLKLKRASEMNFKQINVINVSEVAVFIKAAQKFVKFYYRNYEIPFDNYEAYNDFEIDYGNYYYHHQSCRLQALLFENIKSARIEFPIESTTCNEIRSLSFINIKSLIIPYLSDHAYNLDELLLRNVTIDSATKFINNGLVNDIIISNSKFNHISGTFISCSATQVVLSNNYFGTIFSSNYFNLRADNISFSGNTFEFLEKDSFNLISNNIAFINNTFYHIKENAFRQITGPSTSPKFNISSSYTFSNNIIHSLEKNALIISPKTISPRSFYKNITITNNSVNCNCGNMFWLDSLFQKKNNVEEYYFYSKWMKENNLNKCFNIPNCLVKEILYDLRELCGEDFECPKNPIKNKPNNDEFYLKQKEHILSSIMSYNNEMNQNNSNLMQSLIERIESKNVEKLDKKLEKETIIKNNSVLINYERRNNEKHSWKFSEINMIHSCLLIMLILFCLTLCYIVLEKLSKISSLRVFVLKFWPRPKSVVIEGDVTSSSISELVSNI